jgi:hypothetical protein
MRMIRMIGNTMLMYFGAASRVTPNTNGTRSREIRIIARIFGILGKVFVSAYAVFYYFTLSSRRQ